MSRVSVTTSLPNESLEVLRGAGHDVVAPWSSSPSPGALLAAIAGVAVGFDKIDAGAAPKTAVRVP
jgi:lactate dehydrogenase-like 2-hydroxyacid dehydrogenase